MRGEVQAVNQQIVMFGGVEGDVQCFQLCGPGREEAVAPLIQLQEGVPLLSRVLTVAVEVGYDPCCRVEHAAGAKHSTYS